MDKKIFAIVAARAKVRLKDYRFYGEGDAGHEIYANIERVEILSGISISPLAYEDLGSLRLKYKSADSYINLRQSPNGTIITQIKRECVAKDFGGGLVAKLVRDCIMQGRAYRLGVRVARKILLGLECFISPMAQKVQYLAISTNRRCFVPLVLIRRIF